MVLQYLIILLLVTIGPVRHLIQATAQSITTQTFKSGIVDLCLLLIYLRLKPLGQEANLELLKSFRYNRIGFYNI